VISRAQRFPRTTAGNVTRPESYESTQKATAGAGQAFGAPGFTIAEHVKGWLYLSNPFNKELESRLIIDGVGASFPTASGFTVYQRET
jgi:hypothetical protein